MMRRKPFEGKKVIGYLRVSTADQDTKKNEADILKFANDRNLGQVTFVSEKVSGAKSWKKRRLKGVVDDLGSGDTLIVPELSRLGRSLIEVLEILNILHEKKAAVFSVKENFQLNGTDMQSKVMRTMFALFAEIERDLISIRTKEGLAAARAKGRLLGRPKGPGKSKLDQYRPEIEALLKNGSRKNFIAERYGVTPATISNWLKRHRLNKIKPKP
jgi:DNA invertase Pin-like site-specific DNA recombinase